MTTPGQWNVAEGREWMAIAKGRCGHRMGQREEERTKAWESTVVMRKDQQHYKRTPHIELAMTYSISRTLKPLPNILAITGGVS